jgi:hypothetical protein
LSNSGGTNNTAVGNVALLNSLGDGNTAIGASAGINVTTASNAICIGIPGQNVSNSCFIGNVFATTSVGGIGVLVNASGQLGTSTSSRRFKENLKPMENASETLYALKPVSFRYKKEIDPAGVSQFGLVAEDVEKVNPNLVVRDEEGKAYSVRYDQVNAMLLNEFLKEHQKVNAQQQQIDALTMQLKKQEARIQKISDQVDQTNKPVELAETSH